MHPKILALSQQANYTAGLARVATHGSMNETMAAISSDTVKSGKAIYEAVKVRFAEVRAATVPQTPEQVFAKLMGALMDATATLNINPEPKPAAARTARPR